MKNLLILGSKDLGQLIAYHARVDGHYNLVGFLDDFAEVGSHVEGVEVLGSLSLFEELYEQKVFDEFMIGIGYKHMAFRKECYEKYSKIAPLAQIIHSSCHVEESATVGRGCFLLPGCVLDMGVKISDNCLLNTACVVAHDSSVGANTFLGPGVNVAGFVELGAESFIGAATCIIDNIRTCAGVQTGAGAVVIKDIDQPGLYLGVPAKIKS